MSRVLDVWMNGEHIGVWRLPSRDAPEFVYDASWLESPAFHPLSLSRNLDQSGGKERTGQRLVSTT
jgi:HipA-like protein